MSAVVVRAAGLCRRYGDLVALDGVDFTLRAGQRVALLGPNGAGKTTLIRIIAGRLSPDTGVVDIGGARAGSAAARRAIGLVPQRIALYPALTVNENLDVFGRLHGVSGSGLAARIAHALEWTGLAEYAACAVAKLSGGMQRRLNIACGALHEPALLLLDEPTVGVDAASRERIHGMLGDLRARGVSILESTHQIDDVESSCDRVMIMRDGRLLASGSVQDLIRASHLTEHACRVTLDQPPAGLALAASFEVRGAVVTGHVRDVVAELGTLLSTIRAAGLEVREVQIDPPHLEDVFAHLTGGSAPA